jgi:hypothetical protein
MKPQVWTKQHLVPAMLTLGIAFPASAAIDPYSYFSDFTGPFEVDNWTVVKSGGDVNDGGVDTSNAPDSVTLLGSDSGPFGVFDVDFVIAAPLDAAVTFNWNFITENANASFDPFGYLLNGSFRTLTKGALADQSGFAKFYVEAGDVFGFRQRTTDNHFGRGTTEVFNFQVVPVPATVALFLVGLGALRVSAGTKGRPHRRTSICSA